MGAQVERKRHSLAHYKCIECGRKWSEKPGPDEPTPVEKFNNLGTVCECGSKYVKWLNYEEWKKCHAASPLSDE